MDSGHDPLRKIPTKHAPEARADIGTALKAARARKGHTLEAVAQHTRIPKKFLDALENNRFDEFPALAYLRGFLKSYCDYLELDFEPLWKQVTAPPPAPEPEAPAAAPAAAAPAAPVSKPEPKKKKEEPMPDHSHAAHHAPQASAPLPSSGPIGPIMLALILALLGAIAFFASTARAPAPATVEAPGAQGFGTAPSENALTLELREEAFVTVTIDGKQVFMAKVPKGARQEWKSAKAIDLKVSNPAAVSATLNGAELKLPAPDASGTIRIEAR